MRHTGMGFTLLFAALAACSDGATGITDGVVRAVPMPPALVLQNRSGDPVHYFVVERQTTALIDWLPCAGPTCAAVAGDSSLSLPFARIAGWAPDASEVVVYWWRSVPSGLPGGGFVADSIRYLNVGL